MKHVAFWVASLAVGVGLPFLACRWAMSRLDGVLGVTIRRRR